MLTIQAHIPRLKPPNCVMGSTNGLRQTVQGGKSSYAICRPLSCGPCSRSPNCGTGIKGLLPPHGAEQFDETTVEGRKRRSEFFNYFVFSLSCGALFAFTFVVWIEDNKVWQLGLGVSTSSILLSIPVYLLGSHMYRTKVPVGSPITPMFKVHFSES